MENKLLCVTPPITSYPSIANQLSVLWAHKEDTMPWLASEYIQLVSRKKEHWKFKMAGTFYEHGGTGANFGCPFLEMLKLNREIIDFEHRSLFDFIKYCIDRNYYIRIWLDWFYIPESSLYQKENYPHPTFIYGYDDDKEEIIAADFYMRKYKEIRISNIILDQAYKSVMMPEKRLHMTETVSLYKYRDIQCNVNLQKIIRDYQDYVNSEDGYRIYKNDPDYANVGFSFGISFYDVLDYLIKDAKFDFRPFQVLLDHKVMQDYRLRYLNENGYISNGEILIQMSEKLTKNCEILRNKILKIIYANDQTGIDDAIKYNAKLKTMDKLLAKNIIANVVEKAI